MQPSGIPNRREIGFGEIPGPSFRTGLSEIRTSSSTSIILSNDRKPLESRGETLNDLNVLIAVPAFGNDREITLPSESQSSQEKSTSVKSA